MGVAASPSHFFSWVFGNLQLIKSASSSSFFFFSETTRQEKRKGGRSRRRRWRFLMFFLGGLVCGFLLIKIDFKHNPQRKMTPDVSRFAFYMQENTSCGVASLPCLFCNGIFSIHLWMRLDAWNMVCFLPFVFFYFFNVCWLRV